MGKIGLLWKLYQLKRNVKKAKTQIMELREKKLHKLLAYAYAHSAYYRGTFEAKGITSKNMFDLPLSAFPTIDKQTLLTHFDEIVTTTDLTQDALCKFDAEESKEQDTYRGKYHVVHSSGSTGKPGYFVYDDKAWSQMLLGIIRAALWDMTMPEILKLLANDPRIAYIAATDGRYGGAMAVSGGIKGVGARQMFLDVKTPLDAWVEKIKAFKPNLIIGYPSAIKILGELVHKGEVEVEVCRVISCGEPLNPGMRDFLESTFHAKVVNIYGASESLALGVELGDENGMMLFDDLNYIEVEHGTMYLTSLYNFAQPLIRYKISDKLVLKNEPYKGKGPFTQAKILLGRGEDLLWFEDGNGKRDFLHPLAIEGFCIEGLLDYQFCQAGPDAFEMLAEVSEARHEEKIRFEMLRQMKEILREKHLEYIQFYVRFVEEILPDQRTGKKPLIVKNINDGRLAV